MRSTIATRAGYGRLPSSNLIGRSGDGRPACAAQRNALDGAPAAIFHHLGLMRARIADAARGVSRALAACGCHQGQSRRGDSARSGRRRSGPRSGESGRSRVGAGRRLPRRARRLRFAGKNRRRDSAGSRLGSLSERRQLRRAGADRRRTQMLAIRRHCVGLRVNPMVGGGTIEHTSVASVEFQIRRAACRPSGARIIAAFAEYPWLTRSARPRRFPRLRARAARRSGRRGAELRREIMAETGRDLTHVDIGGGLPTAYHNVKRPRRRRLPRCSSSSGHPTCSRPDVRLITEFGRAIQANCGIAASRVEYVKPAAAAGRHPSRRRFSAPHRSIAPTIGSTSFSCWIRLGMPKPGPERPLTIAGRSVLPATSWPATYCCRRSSRRLDRDPRRGGLHAQHVVASLQPGDSGRHWLRSRAGRSAARAASRRKRRPTWFDSGDRPVAGDAC